MSLVLSSASVLAGCGDSDGDDGTGGTQPTSSTTVTSSSNASTTVDGAGPSSGSGVTCSDEAPADATPLSPTTITIVNDSAEAIYVERPACSNGILELDGKGTRRTWSQWSCEDAAAEACDNLPGPDCIDNDPPIEIAAGASHIETWGGGVVEEHMLMGACKTCTPPVGAPLDRCASLTLPAAGSHELELSFMRGPDKTPATATAMVTLPASTLTITIE